MRGISFWTTAGMAKQVNRYLTHTTYSRHVAWVCLLPVGNRVIEQTHLELLSNYFPTPCNYYLALIRNTAFSKHNQVVIFVCKVVCISSCRIHVEQIANRTVKGRAWKVCSYVFLFLLLFVIYLHLFMVTAIAWISLQFTLSNPLLILTIWARCEVCIVVKNKLFCRS